MDNDIQHFADLIKNIKFTMLTTFVGGDGSFNSRPMTLQQVEFDGSLWFFAGLHSRLLNQVVHNPTVNLTFVHPRSNAFLSASGQAYKVIDMEKMKDLWNPLYKAWFPEGLNDPNLCLIKVEIESADYWETPSSKLITFANFAKNLLGSKTDQAVLAKRGHIEIH